MVARERGSLFKDKNSMHNTLSNVLTKTIFFFIISINGVVCAGLYTF
jgi:hypothetical protein